MLDVSDGLVADARHLALASDVDIDIRASNIEVAEPMQAVGAAIGCDPMDFILNGGDDYCLLATFPAAVELPDGFHAIGVVGSVSGEQPTVTVNGQAHEGSGGHRHF